MTNDHRSAFNLLRLLISSSDISSSLADADDMFRARISLSVDIALSKKDMAVWNSCCSACVFIPSIYLTIIINVE